MKHLRSAAAVAAALALAVSVVGCGAASSASSSTLLGPAANYDYQNFTYSQGLDANGHWEGVSALDYVTLPEDYAAIPLKKSDVEPSEEDIQTLWDNLLESNRVNQPVTGRPAETGDIANIDYSGTVDGVVFTGGTAQGYDLTLGSGSFIDGFEDQIIGHNIGDSFDVTVTFPDDYGDSTDEAGNPITLSGKEAVFSVTLNSLAVSVLPEATDAWVEENFGASNDLHTVADVDQYFHDSLYDSNLTNAIVDYLTENAEISSVPQVLLNYQVCSQLSYYNSYASMFGYESLDEFLSGFMGYDNADALLADTESDILNSCNQLLIFQAVAESLDLAPTDAELEAYASYTETMGEGYVHLLALQDKVLSTLREGAQIS
ncbi:FKBP-type peptidyl-prolyl cis-trans isomerase [Faecalibacterium sp. An58]|uniref:FKBP-type peptidyl-prolyl cis-trans isomerase n=1 Tax=Faecalibacterium sp. An58 TaxID=1965648 RepID=UPI001FA83A99|nr:FKBP-type peptidyl-prolyl cis-trans isomerase [Faecalibacterium sp. An58]